MHVHPVGDHLHGRPRVVQQRHHRSRLTMVDRPHGVEQVGADGCPGVQRLPGDRIGGIGMPQRGHRAGLHDAADRGQPPVQLGSQRHQPDGATAKPQESLHLRRLRGPQEARVMGATLLRAEPGALQVHPGEQPVGDQVGQRDDHTLQLGQPCRHQAGHRGGGAVATVEVHHPRRLVLVAGRVGPSTAAVDVQVDEPRDNYTAPQLEIGLTRRRPLAHRRQPVPNDLHPARVEDAVGDDDPTSSQHRHARASGIAVQTATIRLRQTGIAQPWPDRPMADAGLPVSAGHCRVTGGWPAGYPGRILRRT